MLSQALRQCSGIQRKVWAPLGNQGVRWRNQCSLVGLREMVAPRQHGLQLPLGSRRVCMVTVTRACREWYYTKVVGHLAGPVREVCNS